MSCSKAGDERTAAPPPTARPSAGEDRAELPALEISGNDGGPIISVKA